MPLYGGYAAFAFFAALGLPGLSGFISESLVFLGAFQEQKLLACLGTLGILLGAAYMLWTYQRVFMGPVNEKYKDYKDMNKIEIASLFPLAFVVLVLGIFPFHLLGYARPHCGQSARSSQRRARRIRSNEDRRRAGGDEHATVVSRRGSGILPRRGVD